VRKRVQRLMRKMGIAALDPKPRTSKPEARHKVFPYLLRGLVIDRPNQVWAADITYRAPRPTVGEAYDWNAKEKGGLKRKMTCPLL